MPGRWLSLLLSCTVVLALPYHQITRPEDEVESEESRKVLGSSVVTSVSVIMDLGNGTKKYIADALGKPVPKPTAGTAVGSPPSLLSPDRYEFYTFDETGDLVKRLMTLEEIQSIIAGGEGETLIQQKPSYYHQSLPPEIQPPLPSPIDEGNVDELIEDAMGEYSSSVLGVREVVANVQNVLKNELEAKKNKTPVAATLPPASIDSSAEWGSFIPTAQFSSEFTTSLKPPKITTKSPYITSRLPSTTAKSPSTNKRPTTTTKLPSITSRRPATSTKRPVTSTQIPVSTSSKPTTISTNKPTPFYSEIISSSKKPFISSTKPVISTTKYRPSSISVSKPPSSTTEKTQSTLYSSSTGSFQDYSSIKSSAIPETTYIKISQSTPSIATEKPFISKINQHASATSQSNTKDKPNKVPITAFTNSDLTVIKDVVNNTITSAAQNATANPPPFAILTTSASPSTTTTKPAHYTTLQSTSNAITVVTSKTSESTLPPLEVLLELIQSTQSEDSETIPSTITNNEITNDKQDENYETTYYSNVTPNSDIPSLSAMESNIMTEISNATNMQITSTNTPGSYPTFNANQISSNQDSTTSKISSATNSSNKLQTSSHSNITQQPLSNLKISSSGTNNSNKPVKIKIPDPPLTEKDDSFNNEFLSTIPEEQSTVQYTDYPLSKNGFISNTDKNVQHLVSSDFYETTSIENVKSEESTPQYTQTETQTITLYGAPQDELDITAELADSVSSVLSQVAPEVMTTIVPPDDGSTTEDRTTFSDTLLGGTETTHKYAFNKITSFNNKNSNNFLKISSSYGNTESAITNQPESTTLRDYSEESTMQLVSSSEDKQDSKIKTKFTIQNKAETDPEIFVKKSGETSKIGIKQNSDNSFHSTTVGRTTLNAKFSERESTEAMTTDSLDSTTDESELRFAQNERETVLANEKYVTETGNENKKEETADVSDQDSSEEYQPLFTTLQYIGTATRFLDSTTTIRPVINDKIPSASHIKGTQVKYIDEDKNIDLTTESDMTTTVIVHTRNSQNNTIVSNETEDDIFDSTTAEISTVRTADTNDATTLRILSKTSENDSDGEIFTTVSQTSSDPENFEATTGNILLKGSLNIDQQDDDTSIPEFLTTTEYEDATIESESESQTQKLGIVNNSIQLKKDAISIVIVNVTENPTSVKYNESGELVTGNKADPTALPVDSVSVSDLKDENLITTVKIPTDKLTTDTLWTLISTRGQNETKLTSTEPSNSTLDNTSTAQNITVHPLRIGSANENTSAGLFPNLPPPYSAVDLYPAPEENLGLESTTINVDTDVKDFSDLCNELAFKLWGSLSSKGLAATRSLVLSPFAATALLAMVFLGARGSTSGQMNDILRLDDMVTFNPHQVFRNVTESVVLVRNPGIATAAFVRELFSDKVKGKLLDFYKERAQQFYDGHVEEVGFSAIGDILKRRTNMLIKRQTFNKVPEYLRNTNFNLRPPLAAFSANIFQTACHKASIEGRDGEMYFTVTPSTRQRRLVPIPAAVWRSGFLAGYDPKLDATAVAIGTGVEDDSLISTIFVLPGQQGQVAAGDGLMRLEKRLIKSSHTKGAWSRLLRSLLFRPGLEVQIPRFSHRSLVNITGPLQRMGLKDLFAEGRADLRGLNGLASDLHLSDIVQVNTFGTCGEETRDSRHHVEIFPSPPHRSSRDDGNTDLLIDDDVPLALRPRQARLPDNPRLRFDRPFLYFVRHNPTGFVLYMGRFNPRLLH